MAKGFYLKLVAVFFVVLAASIFIGASALLTPYFLSTVNKRIASERLENQKNLPTPALKDETLALVNEIDSQLSLVEGLRFDGLVISEDIFDRIIEHKSNKIRIVGISYSYDLDSGTIVGVSGIASSREDLLGFQQSIKDDPYFEEVNLPISNFIKSSDIGFSLDIKVSNI